MAASLALLVTLLVPGTGRAQSGSFITPSLRGHTGEFAFWDRFFRPTGSTANSNYNYPNLPALLDGTGADDDGNLTTLPGTRVSLIQTGTPTAFVTSTASIYSFSEATAFEVPFTASTANSLPVNNVIFQTQTGGSRLDLSSVKLVYKIGTETHSVDPQFRAMDDPQTGAFSERVVCGFQWDLTGLGVRDFKIVFASPAPSMPLWQAQIDVVTGLPFVQELGYLLTPHSRPVTRDGSPGSVDTNVPVGVDDRYFHAGQQLHVLGIAELDWEHVGWLYDGQVSATSQLDLTFPAHDISVTALFAPLAYDAWRELMFNHLNSLTSTPDDVGNDLVSGLAVDHDGDGISNAAEYAFGGDPYTQDNDRTQPLMMTVDVGGVSYPAIRYRTNGAPAGAGDVNYKVRLSTDLIIWKDNGTTPTTTTFSSVLQADGTRLVTERALQPSSAFTFVMMDVAWSAAGLQGIAEDAPVIANTSLLAVGLTNAIYSVPLSASSGTAPYTWSLLSGTLPAGLTLGADGVLSGTPTTVATSTFVVKVKDSNNFTGTRSMTLVVLSAPFITTASPLPGGFLNSGYTAALSATDGTAPYTWAISSSTLPAGLNISTAGVISGTAAAEGASTFTVEVTDSNNLKTTKELHLAITLSPITTASPLPPGVKNQAYWQVFSATGGAAALTWSVPANTLPTGLTLSASGILSGKPTVAVANAPFSVTVTDGAAFTATRGFTLTITASYTAPVMTPPVLGTTTIGVPFSYQLNASNYPKTFTVTGLPPGLTCVSSTIIVAGETKVVGVISGRPTVAGAFSVKVKATNTGGSSPILTVPMVVKALPNTLMGSFTGLVSRDPANSNLGALLSLTTTPTGAFTAKVTTGVTVKTYTGFLAASSPQIDTLATAALPKLTLALDASTNLLSGSYNGAAVSGWRQVWNATTNPPVTRQGYYSMSIEQTVDDGLVTTPHGSGYATFTVAPAGTLTVTGKTADGLVISTAGFVGPTGQIAVYTSLYANLGSVTGPLKLDQDPNGSFSENVVSGPLTWVKPLVAASKTYPAAFSLSLSAYGKYLAHTTVGAVEVLGLPDTGTANLLFEDGGLDQSATDPDVTGFTYTDANAVIMPTAASGHNPGKAVLTIAKATGLVGGTFTLVDTAPALTRKVTFQGQIVRPASGNARAVGYFLLTQKPGTATSAVLSGKVSIQQ